MRNRTLWLIVPLVLGVAGCMDPERASTSTAPATTKTASIATSAKQPQSQLLARKVALALRVDALVGASQQIETLLANGGGYVVSSESKNLNEDGASMRYNVKVPPAQLTRFLGEVEKLGRLTKKAVSTENLTTQIVDVEARLRTMRAQEQAWNKTLADTRKQSEALELQERLMRLIAEIESASAQQKALRAQVQMSDVEIDLVQGPTGPQDANWLATAWQDSTSSFGWVLKGLAETLVWLGVYSPCWLTVVGLLWAANRTRIRPVSRANSNPRNE